MGDTVPIKRGRQEIMRTLAGQVKQEYLEKYLEEVCDEIAKVLEGRHEPEIESLLNDIQMIKSACGESEESEES